ncbi:MAG: type II toxin-antitoxin system Phd/YefM family antitoxin [Nitrospirae bacterium]|nr:MAG: type II toxin-antitoxin system Phd/YefM family antitoxin [Nitrospirota bacterium]
MIVTANDLKVKGISYLEGLVKTYTEIVISVRGRNKFVVLPIEEYERLKEADLEMAVRESEEDYRKGRYTVETAAKHFKRVGI